MLQESKGQVSHLSPEPTARQRQIHVEAEQQAGPQGSEQCLWGRGSQGEWLGGCEDRPAPPRQTHSYQESLSRWGALSPRLPALRGHREPQSCSYLGLTMKQPRGVAKPPLLLRDLDQPRPPATGLPSPAHGDLTCYLSLGRPPGPRDVTAGGRHPLIPLGL